jgi:hypothetical protein
VAAHSFDQFARLLFSLEKQRHAGRIDSVIEGAIVIRRLLGNGVAEAAIIAIEGLLEHSGILKHSAQYA